MITRFSSHFFDVQHGIPASKTPDIQLGKLAKILAGVALLFVIGIGFYSLSSKTSDTPSDKITVAHVRPVWH